jgi:3-methyl-2-oxobutanoate hydroxymethyltransferase
MKITDFSEKKIRGEKISVVTAYDYSMAQIVADSPVDAILVGDSVAMVVHGLPSTIQATLEMMVIHTESVRRGAPNAFVIADMPFLTYRKGSVAALEAAGRLMCAGASAVKLEGIKGHEGVVEQLVGSGIPVMGHLGLIPQSVHQLGGYKVQGADEARAEEILGEAKLLEALGAFSLVLECVPAPLAERISQQIKIPTIGIGAGALTDGQVLVWHDLLGLSKPPLPRFVRTYLQGREEMKAALMRYHEDVLSGSFPNDRESYRAR